MHTVDARITSNALPITSDGTPDKSRPPLTLADLQRWFCTAAPGDALSYYRGYLIMDRALGSRLGEEAVQELDHIATAVMAMAEAGHVHLVQRRNGPYDYVYCIVVAARHGGRRGSGRQAPETAS